MGRLKEKRNETYASLWF